MMINLINTEALLSTLHKLPLSDKSIGINNIGPAFTWYVIYAKMFNMVQHKNTFLGNKNSKITFIKGYEGKQQKPKNTGSLISAQYW